MDRAVHPSESTVSPKLTVLRVFVDKGGDEGRAQES